LFEQNQLICLSNKKKYKKLVQQQDVENEDKLRELKNDRDKWQEKMNEILDLAIHKAKSNKITQDLQAGGDK
jgi:hypothetical protein